MAKNFSFEFFPPKSPEGADKLRAVGKGAAEPVYEELPGWPAGEAAKAGPLSLSALPENAQRYLARVSSLVGLPFSLVSVGPGREETIVTTDLFARA